MSELKEREKEVELLEKMTNFVKSFEGKVVPASRLLKSIVLFANTLTGGECNYKMDLDTAVYYDDYRVNYITVHKASAEDRVICRLPNKTLTFYIEVDRSMIGTEKGSELMVFEKVKKVSM